MNDEDEYDPRGAGNPPSEYRQPGAERGDPEEPRGDPVGEAGDYPGGQPPRETECVSCGASIPDVAGRRKCASCREQGIEPLDDENGASDAPSTIVQLVFAAVPGASKYFAAAKGSVALDRAPRHSRRVDAVHPVYDFDGAPVDLLTERWGDLPRVCPLGADAGQRLLGRICNAGDDESPVLDAEGVPFIVDTTGDPIDPVGGPGTATAVIRERAVEADPVASPDDDHDVWLMPALALQYDPQFSDRVTTRLQCRRCGIKTLHGYEGRGGAPYTKLGEPIWQCSECRGFTRGPDREAAANTRRKSERERALEYVASLGEGDHSDEISVGEFNPPDS